MITLSTAAAVEAANKWVDVARPIILASMRLDDQPWSELAHLRRFEGQERTWREAKDILTQAQRDLNDMVEGIRDDFISDQRLGCAKSDEEAEAFDEFNDELERDVTSVREAIKQVEAEDWNNYLEGMAA